MSDHPHYYLRHKLIGEKEVTVEQFMEAERQAGFRSKFPGRPATGGFSFGDISGTVRHGGAVPAAIAAPEQEDRGYPPCDYCGTVPDYHPWHGSGLLNGAISKHIHACDQCRCKLPAHDDQEPVVWGSPKTVRQLIRQLQTLDPDLETVALYRLPSDVPGVGGKVRQGHISTSYERMEGQWLGSYKGSGRLVLAFWTKLDPRENPDGQPAMAAAPVRAMKLPEHRGSDLKSPVYGFARGWNTALDAVSQLNAQPTRPQEQHEEQVGKNQGLPDGLSWDQAPANAVALIGGKIDDLHPERKLFVWVPELDQQTMGVLAVSFDHRPAGSPQGAALDSPNSQWVVLAKRPDGQLKTQAASTHQQ